jgi:hypothetical protein
MVSPVPLILLESRPFAPINYSIEEFFLKIALKQQSLKKELK